MNRYDNGINDWNKAGRFTLKAHKLGLMSNTDFQICPTVFHFGSTNVLVGTLN